MQLVNTSSFACPLCFCCIMGNGLTVAVRHFLLHCVQVILLLSHILITSVFELGRSYRAGCICSRNVSIDGNFQLLQPVGFGSLFHLDRWM